MAINADDAFVDAYVNAITRIEHALECIGRQVCDVNGSADTHACINTALSAISEAIHSAWRMRPVT